jgi:hypothetical protein
MTEQSYGSENNSKTNINSISLLCEFAQVLRDSPVFDADDVHQVTQIINKYKPQHEPKNTLNELLETRASVLKTQGELLDFGQYPELVEYFYKKQSALTGLSEHLDE